MSTICVLYIFEVFIINKYAHKTTAIMAFWAVSQARVVKVGQRNRNVDSQTEGEGLK